MTTAPLQRFVEQNGMDTRVTSPDELAQSPLAECERWGSIIRDAGIQPE